MRSTEQSGVGDERFDLADRAVSRPLSRSNGFFGSISAFSYMVGLLALLVATFVVATDWAQSFDQLDRRAAFYQELDRQPATAEFVASALGPMMGSVDEGETSTEVMQRAALTYALALLVTGLAFRRRKAASDGDVTIPGAELIDTVPFGLACWTADGKLVACNLHYGGRLGGGAAFEAGMDYKASIRQLVRGGSTEVVREDEQSRVLELRRKDGSCLLIDERPLPSGGFVTLVTDITESRRADSMLSAIREEQRVLARRYHEEKLRAEAASRAKTSFLAHLSHDIRTPLNAIIGFAEMMRQQTYGPLGDPRYDGYADSIKLSGERLLGFFGSILDLAELEGGRRVLEAEELGVDELMDAVAHRFAGEAQRARLSLRLGAPCGARVCGDRFSLERMLGNLVDNAIRFTPGGGRITIAAYAAMDGVVLEVSDTGIGMSPERLAIVSQPFAFGDAALTKDREGAGLGLAIARTIVEISGGRLAIDSRPGLGTTVAVSLPLKTMVVPVDQAA